MTPTDRLLLPGNLHTAAKIDTAAEHVDKLLTTTDGDELADRLEAIVGMTADSYGPGALIVPGR